MTALHEVDPGNPGRSAGALSAAAEALGAGGLVVVPTETVYGLAARPDLPDATRRVFEAKGRPARLNLPVLAPEVGEAWGVAEPNEPARALARAFWPGALTLVLPRAERARGWALGETTDSIAVRVPDHALTRALLAAVGPLAVTSANPSGRPPLDRPDAILETFGGLVDVVLVLAPGTPAPRGTPSTVLDCTGSRGRILRRGAVDPAALLRAVPWLALEAQ